MKVKSDWLGRILNWPNFVVQKAATPKSGVEFKQKSIGATSYTDMRRRPAFCPIRSLWWVVQNKAQADQFYPLLIF